MLIFFLEVLDALDCWNGYIHCNNSPFRVFDTLKSNDYYMKYFFFMFLTITIIIV